MEMLPEPDQDLEEILEHNRPDKITIPLSSLHSMPNHHLLINRLHETLLSLGAATIRNRQDETSLIIEITWSSV